MPKPRIAASTRTALLALALAFAAGCGPGGGPGRELSEVELVDFSAPGMFKQAANQLQRPYVLELPPWSIDERHELRLADATERSFLEELCRLDPGFQYEMADGAWVLWPTGEAGRESPFSRRLETFQARTGAFDAIRRLVAAALPADTQVVAGPGESRPVELELRDASVRDVLVAIAAQARLGMQVEPGSIRFKALPEPR